MTEDSFPTKSDAEILPVQDLFDYDDDPVDFMSAESFPASDPPPVSFAPWTQYPSTTSE